MNTDFIFDFDQPAWIWAAHYRKHGLQVIPCQGKMPLGPWKEFQNELVSDATFDGWGAEGGRFRTNNIGVVLGKASGAKFMLDLDTYKSPAPAAWWAGVLAVHNNAMELETWEQVTGGGGRQLFFQCPEGWSIGNGSTALNVDVRGQAGFAVLPPSLHASGRRYAWVEGRAPGQIDILVAPQWLIDELEALFGAHGKAGAPREATAQPETEYGPFGTAQDGREKLMSAAVYHGVLEWYRELSRQMPNPPQPFPTDWEARAFPAYEGYEQKVTSRIPGVPKREGLEREDPPRGLTAFGQKWRATMRHWGSPRMVADASKPNPKGERDWTADFGPQVEEPKIDPATGQPLPLILTSAQFVKGFLPPAYLIDGVLQRGYLYSFTARTNHGKTAVSMWVGAMVARGEAIHGRAVHTGTVLFLAGENPQDIRARYMVLCESIGVDPDRLKYVFIDGVINVAEKWPVIEAEAAGINDLVLVIVDTAAAYFLGDETNSNAQQGAYARMLRRLTKLPGNPACLVNCHPVKNATQENLLPMGGSAFLNEVDGNFTLWADANRQVTMHWLGKHRGPDFDPMHFELRISESKRVCDAQGRLMPAIVAVPVASMTVDAGRVTQESDENTLMRALHANPQDTFEQLAVRCGFSIEGRPSKARVHRTMQSLLEYKFVVKYRRGKYKLTPKGKAEIKVKKDDDETFG